MFTKLRNKFLILNMSITSIVMLAAFAIIYIITYSNIHSEIENKLKSRSEMLTTVRRSDLPNDTPNNTQNNIEKFPADNPPKENGLTQRFYSGDALLFNIEVDRDGQVLNIDSLVDLPETAYYTAAETAWNNKNSTSTITLEGRQWQYAINPISVQVILENGQQYTTTENKYQITFLDVTEYNKTLFKLLTTLLSVGLIMLFVIFIISIYFANRAIKPIAETWEKQKQFVADASHELKTPLSIINANYDALMSNQEETIKSQMKWLDYIKIGTDRMAELINELLSLAKMDDVNVEIDKMPFNINSAINDVMLAMEARMIEKGIKLTHTIESDIIAKGDSEKVKQVVTILLDNAIKYTNENGQIDVSLTKSKNLVICSIKNTGKGIAQQDLPKVFNRFFRADLSRTHDNGSYGLGLSIAKTILDRLGGEIHATSVENEWTTFTFTLNV